MKLTKRIIDSTPSPISTDGKTEQLFLRDDNIPGFAVRITSGGARSFILEKRVNGRMRRWTIGAYGPMTLEQARTEANKQIGRIAAGEDPAEDQQKRKKEITFGDLSDMYKERHLGCDLKALRECESLGEYLKIHHKAALERSVSRRKRSIKNDLQMLKSYLSVWNNRKLSSITRNDAALLHSKMNSTPYAANRVLSLLHKMFSLAKIWGVYDGENPIVGLERYREKKRDRFATFEEFPTIAKAIRAEPNQYIQAAIWTLIFTGPRKQEALKMQWPEVDFKMEQWSKPTTKSGEPHLIPLPKFIVAILSRLPKVKGNPHVFPGRLPGKPLSDVRAAWSRIRTRSGIKDLRLHDLRRTLGSWMVMGGESLPMIGRVLNHTQAKTTAIYARFALDPVRKAMETNAKKMIQIGKLGDLVK